MKSIISPDYRATLFEFARRHVLLAFDFDGTLAPIVARPEAAAMREHTRALLEKIARLYPCVVVSGRSRADVKQKLEGIRLRAIVGNHGMEPARNLRAARWLAALWQAQLAAALPKTAGLHVEDKGVSLTVHYRKTRRQAVARREILSATGELLGARIVEGKKVVNVLPQGAANKGTAVLELCKRWGCESIIYVGDDDTDEDVFALAGKSALLAIRVGRARTSHAEFYLPTQRSMDRFLSELLRARVAKGT